MSCTGTETRAQAALALAQANLEAAQSAKAITLASVEAAQVQYALALSTARLQSLPERRGQWKETLPDEIVLPVWYFEAGEEIAAAQEEVQASLSALEKEQEYFDTLTADLGNTDFVDAETVWRKLRRRSWWHKMYSIRRLLRRMTTSKSMLRAFTTQRWLN